MLDEIVIQLAAKFGDDIKLGPKVATGDEWLECRVDSLLGVAKYLRETLGYDYLNSVTAVDYCQTDEKKKIACEPHLEVVYHLSKLASKTSLVMKVLLPRWANDNVGELPDCPSVAAIWSTADWHEREVYDLFGVEFVGHPNMVRILCPEDWEGHPLRKDYEMPLEYHGIRGR